MAMYSEKIEVTPKHMAGIKKLKKIFPCQLDLAYVLNLTSPNVNAWYLGKVVIPELQARRIVDILDGAISLYDLRPDRKKLHQMDKKRLQSLKS